jgi:hypothetical protein
MHSLASTAADMNCLEPFASARDLVRPPPLDSAGTNVPTIACYSRPLLAGVLRGLPLGYMFTLGKLKYSDITSLTCHWTNVEPNHHHAVLVHLAYHIYLPFSH